MAATQIAPFRPELTGAFKALNEAWITALFALEPNDSPYARADVIMELAL